MTARARASVPLVIALLCAACGSGGGSAGRGFEPDVPAWRGGCFLSGPSGKIVNGSAAADVVAFGSACTDPPGPGGLVYLDRFDPVSGDGDVTVLSAAPGSRPVVVAPHGGGGAIEVGVTEARIDAAQAHLLTLANVSFVTGDLVLAPLPGATPVQTLATRVRIGNYDFAGSGVVYVANYDAGTRTGDLYYWEGGTPRLVGASASRFDFLMYRLARDGRRVASLRSWTEATGGDLRVDSLPPATDPPPPIAQRVYRMSWTDDGHLVYRTVNDDGITYALWAWDGNSSRLLAPVVESALVVGDDVIFATDWSVLDPRALLHVVAATGGPDRLGGVGPAALTFTAVRPPGSAGLLAYVDVPPGAGVADGILSTTPLAAASVTAIDSPVSVEAGAGLSPGAGFVSYAIGFAQPVSPGSANPQPGIAREVKVAAVGGGEAFVLARNATTFVAWDPGERFVAAADGYAPATNRGQLVLRRTADGAQLLSIADVGNGQFGFADDGSFLWAIRDWDDALRRGTLVLSMLGDGGASEPVLVSADVTWVAQAHAGRVLYGVGGSARAGLWVGGG